MKASKRILCAILCVLLITASGCGNGGHGTQKTADNGKRPVMGRYVEEEYSLEDAAGEKPNQIKAIEKLADGNIRMIIEEKGIFESQDQGKKPGSRWKLPGGRNRYQGKYFGGRLLVPIEAWFWNL